MESLTEIEKNLLHLDSIFKTGYTFQGLKYILIH